MTLGEYPPIPAVRPPRPTVTCDRCGKPFHAAEMWHRRCWDCQVRGVDGVIADLEAADREARS